MSALRSLAAGLSVNEAWLLDMIAGYDEARLNDWAGVAPGEAMPAQILEPHDLTATAVAAAFDGASYFHATRAADPESFWRSGLLPLAMAVDGIWEELRSFTEDLVQPSEWARYRQQVESGPNASQPGCQYMLKLEHPEIGGGPFARLVREVHLNPQRPERDYLRNAPEIVEDIIELMPASKRGSIYRRYMAATRPCLVKFRTSEISAIQVESALWYVRDKSVGRPPGRWAAQGGFSGNGSPIPASAIAEVEVLGE